MRTQLKLFGFTLLFAVLISGCSSQKIVKTYEGDALPNQAISILTAPENITLLSVNGEPVPQYLLSNLDVNYGLKAGDNLVVFKYESIWSKAKRDEDTGSRVDTVESEPMAVKIPALAGKQYTFNFVPPTNVREAKKLAASFVGQILDENQGLVAESMSLKSYQADIDSQQAEDLVLNAGDKPVQDDQTDMKDGSVLQRLKVMWPSASADEKKAFLVWVFQK